MGQIEPENSFRFILSKFPNLEVMLAVLATLKFKEDPILEGSKALGADKAPGVEKVSIRVDRLPIFFESLLAMVAIAWRVPRRFRWR